jgi:hypothetical protein
MQKREELRQKGENIIFEEGGINIVFESKSKPLVCRKVPCSKNGLHSVRKLS